MPAIRIDAIGVTARDMKQAIRFYTLLGFDFSGVDASQDHVEPATEPGQVRLMIDSHDLASKLIGAAPEPANHAQFALLCDDPAHVDRLAEAVASDGFKVVTAPWDAFWGQRYSTIADPDGYLIDLFAPL